MAKLKTKTGCLTCVVRKKKCDEGRPKCGHCQRLELSCVQREQAVHGTPTAISATRLKTAAPHVQVAISNGYPPFQSELEKHLSLESPRVLHTLVSRMAGPGFRDVTLFGRFCAQNRLVREAVVAYSAYRQGTQYENSYKLSLKSYQGCIAQLQRTRAYEDQDPAGKDLALTTVFFLGLLEGLKLGDPSNSIAHFEMCRKVLVSRLSQPLPLENPGLVNLYRLAAECIIYNLATFSPFHDNIIAATKDWGSAFDCLFPSDNHLLSPFLGGFHRAYQIMFRINVLLCQHRSASKSEGQASSLVDRAFVTLWQELDKLENAIPNMYGEQMESKATTGLYRAKNFISVYALRIHLIKVCMPSASPLDEDVRVHFTKAIAILREQDVLEPENPSLQWPLTILACTAITDGEFDFLNSKLLEIGKIVLPGVGKMIMSISTILLRSRQRQFNFTKRPTVNREDPVHAFDYLLEPRALIEPEIIE